MTTLLTGVLGLYRGVIGLDVMIQSSGAITYSYCIVTNKKGSLTIVEYDYDMEDFSVLKEKVQFYNFPVVLNASGDMVLTKQVQVLSVNQEPSIFLPGAIANDFFCTTWQTDNKLFGALIRKEIVIKITNSIEDVDVLSVTVGGGIFKQIAELTTSEIAGNYRFHLINDQLEDIVYEAGSHSNRVSIGGQNIESKCLLAYAGAIAYLTEENHTAEESGQLVGQFIYKQKRIGKALVKYGLAAIFILLVANTVLFFLLNSKVESLEREIGTAGYEPEMVDSINKELKIKKDFFEDNNWLIDSRFSFYADRMAMLKPQGLSFSKLEIDPIFKINDEVLEFNQNRIDIAGDCNDVNDVNKWISQLKKESWVKEVTIEDFSNPHDGKQSQFNLRIVYE
jgi:hypothetical protein